MIRNFISYRQMLHQEGYTRGFHFLDGSFVEDVEKLQGRSPNDIDLLSFLYMPTKYCDQLDAWSDAGLPFWQEEVINQNKNKSRFSLDTYGLLMDDIDAPNLITAVIYWYSLFSHQRDSYAWKGFVSIQLDAQADIHALSMLEHW